MPYQIVEVSPSLVLGGISATADCGGFVYSHLRRYCERCTVLPAITVAVSEGRLTATRGFEYLSIAQELGLQRIRAVLQGTTYPELREQGVPGVLEIVSADLLESEETDIVLGWHVFCFENALNEALVKDLEAGFAGFLSQSLSPVPGETARTLIDLDVDLAGARFEVRFLAPVTDYEWMARYRAFLYSIHRDLSPIATYQGRRFAG